MSKLFMLAGGIVEPGGGHAGTLSAYVVYSAGPASRLFKIVGPSGSPDIQELPAATTIDLGRFQAELSQDLAPAVDELRGLGGAANVAQPASAWVCGLVRDHLKKSEGLDII